MITRWHVLLVLFLTGNWAVANNGLSGEDSTKTKYEGPPPLEFVFRPTIGLGTGMFTFYGDIATNHKSYHPTVSRVGYHLRVSNPLTDYLDLSFHVVFGKLGASERSLTRNLNFESRIRTGGLLLSYNFNHFLKEDRFIDPYIEAGFESFEFLSKSDMYDKDGNEYHYWSDGSIRNLEEGSPGSENAVQIYRDYTYETDLRELNIDNEGKYPERSWAIPVGVGANMRLGERVNFRIGTAMHFTLTDLVDNVTSDSEGDRAGTKGKDKFLFTSFSVNYDLQFRKTEDPEDWKPMSWDELQIYVLDTIDSDGDNVVDLLDLCANTDPDHLPVDEKGCPLDTDNDLVPDYRDDEINSAEGALVNKRGVTITDEMLHQAYLLYMDSTGAYAGFDTVSTQYVSDAVVQGGTGDPSDGRKNLKYVIVIGNETKGVSANDLYKYLNYKDSRLVERGDTSYFVIGNFEDPNEANKIRQQLADLIGGDIELAETYTGSEGNTELVTVNTSTLPPDTSSGSTTNITTIIPGKDEFVYRIQIGAFGSEIPNEVFNDLPQSSLIHIKGEDGVVRYFSGVFTDKDLAAEHNINLKKKGYDDAFIVVIKDGKRERLSDGGFKVDPGKDVINETTTTTTIDASLVKFRVQVGAYRNEIPTEKLDLFLQIGEVYPKRDEKSGLIKYIVGEFGSIEEAREFQTQVAREGLEDAFVIGDFKGQLIPAQQALNLLNIDIDIEDP
jgi:hypothetical protein